MAKVENMGEEETEKRFEKQTEEGRDEVAELYQGCSVIDRALDPNLRFSCLIEVVITLSLSLTPAMLFRLLSTY